MHQSVMGGDMDIACMVFGFGKWPRFNDDGSCPYFEKRSEQKIMSKQRIMKMVMVISIDEHGVKRIECIQPVNGSLTLDDAKAMAWCALLKKISSKISEAASRGCDINKLSIDGTAHQVQVKTYELNSKCKRENRLYELVTKDIEL